MTLSFEFEMAIAKAQDRGTCPRCGETDPLAMTKAGICYECRCQERGRSRFEVHHVFGPSYDVTIAIPANFHKALEARRIRRPKVSNPVGSLLFTIAELAETIADRREQHGIPDWLAAFAEIVAGACRDMCDGLRLEIAQ